MGGLNPLFLFAQEIDIDEVTPLELLKGRVFEMDVSNQERLILHTHKGENCILETEFRKELLAQLQEIARENWEVEVSGIFKGYRKYTSVDFIYPQEPSLREEEVKKEGKNAILKIIDVVLIHSINKETLPQEPPNLFTAFAVPPEFQKEYSFPLTLKKITGKVSKCNFKSVIPTIELEGKPDFAIMITAGVEAVKVVGGNLMAFKPKDILKEGTQVEIWYEEKEGLKSARIITILERDILRK